MTSTRFAIFAVASPYAWDVVESARGNSFDPYCIDNFGGADERLPGLISLSDIRDSNDPFVIGLSSAEHRPAAARASFDAGFASPATLVDKSSHVASTSELRHGVYVNAGVVVASHTYIDCHANINRSASIGHDNSIGFAASVGPGATLAGGITLGAAATVGAGAVVLPNITIGRRAVIGAGAVVTRDVADYTVVVGNPSRVLRTVDARDGDDRCPHC
jgi:sugar O-acyltransferase (sialic acid O-acetyltransferase NeuD family)